MKIDEKEFEELYKKENFAKSLMPESSAFILAEFLFKIADKYYAPVEEVGQKYVEWKEKHEKQHQC